MRSVLVLGGKGMVGAAVTRALAGRAADVRVASRSTGVDIVTGKGLDAALAGVDVVVDATNGPPTGRARSVLVDGTRKLLEAGARAGVAHHVAISIVGADRVPMAYYRVKVEQERLVEVGAVPWSIVRATQVHDLVRTLTGGLVRPVAGIRLQPADAGEVGSAVAEVALGAPRRARLTVTGPEIRDGRELARAVRRRSLLLPLPGAVGAALRSGALTDEDPDIRTTITYEQWLTS